MTGRRRESDRAVLGHDPAALAAVFLGGALGSVLRALLETALPWRVGSWPWATFAANLTGAAALAAVLLLIHERRPNRRLLWGTGLCGGLTTFSTLQVEVVRMAAAHEYGLGVAYLTASVAGGLLVAWAVVRVITFVQEEEA